VRRRNSRALTPKIESRNSEISPPASRFRSRAGVDIRNRDSRYASQNHRTRPITRQRRQEDTSRSTAGRSTCRTTTRSRSAKPFSTAAGSTKSGFMPAYEYVGPKRLTDAVHRAAMCRLLETIDPRFKFFGYEMDHRLRSETLQTLLKLSAESFADTHRPISSSALKRRYPLSNGTEPMSSSARRSFITTLAPDSIRSSAITVSPTAASLPRGCPRPH